jgi:hypothetical protein
MVGLVLLLLLEGLVGVAVMVVAEPMEGRGEVAAGRGSVDRVWP